MPCVTCRSDGASLARDPHDLGDPRGPGSGARRCARPRDEALLESALARRRHGCGHDEGIDLIGLAAAYSFDLARDHPIIDGNERVAFQAMCVFLGLNGYRIDAEEAAVVHLMLAVAAGEISEPELDAWLRRHTVER